MKKKLLQKINDNLIIVAENQAVLDAKLNLLLGNENKSIGGGGIKPPQKP